MVICGGFAQSRVLTLQAVSTSASEDEIEDAMSPIHPLATRYG